MTDAPNWLLLNIIADQARTILVANNYTSDAGLRVDLDRIGDTEEGIYPRIAIGEETLTPTGQTVGAISRELTVLCEGYVKADADNAERTAANMKWDIGRALGRIKASAFAGVIENITVSRVEVKGDQPTLRAVADAFTAVQVRIVVTYTEQIPAQ